MTEYRFDCRADRVPSYDDIVFWRETGTKDEDDEVEARDARDGADSIATDMLASKAQRPRGSVTVARSRVARFVVLSTPGCGEAETKGVVVTLWRRA